MNGLPIGPMTFLVIALFGSRIISSQKGWGPKVARANAVWIGSGDTPTMPMESEDLFEQCPNWLFPFPEQDGIKTVVGSVLLTGATNPDVAPKMVARKKHIVERREGNAMVGRSEMRSQFLLLMFRYCNDGLEVMADVLLSLLHYFQHLPLASDSYPLRIVMYCKFDEWKMTPAEASQTRLKDPIGTTVPVPSTWSTS